MVDIPLARADYFREVAKEARIRTRNRYFEQNPVLTDTQSALIARPALRRFLAVGEGPIRAVYSQPGSFSDAAFIVAYDTLWRVDTDLTITAIQTGLFGTSLRGFVSMAATSNIGTTPEFLFIADGRILWVYMEDGYSFGTLAATGAIANGDVVRIGDTYYSWTNGSVDAGTPAGTVGDPWLVDLGASNSEALGNLFDAIGATGTPGTTYSTALTIHPTVNPFSYTSTTFSVRAQSAGVAGDGITTTETGANIAWGSGTLTGGGDPFVQQVPMPDDVGAISVGYLASYVVVIPAQGEGINGRFYWIEPGEITVDALNFATAESAPDPVFGAVIFKDQFWLPGQSTTEVWYFTGNLDAPVLRIQGVAFNRGTWEGTAIPVKESMILVDSDGGVFQISGGLERISPPDIEERIREAIAAQAADPLN
jgi:hypothetical protein